MSDENGTVMTTGASGAEDTAAYDQAKNAEQNSPAGNQPADDTKVADDAGATDTPDGKAEGDDGDGDKAPEDYADFDIPEGVTVADADVDAFKGLAKDAGLNQEQAQKLLTFEAERIRAMNDQYAEQQAQQVQDWAASAKADKEIGGDAFDENVATAVKAMDTFATPEVKEMLNATGLGSHPEFIRMFWKIGQSISSDGIQTGGSAAPPANDARAMFPNSNHN